MKKSLKEWSIQAPWGEIALWSCGNPKGEPVLLVHGRQDSSATFLLLLDHLPTRFHYVAIDLPGHGKSDSFPIGVMILRFFNVAAVEYTIRHLKWNKFTYLAHSMGSEVGLYYGLIHPKKIKKFILLDPNPSIRIMKDVDSEFYFKQYYAKYYSNYDNVNVDNRVYTKEKALEAVKHARGLTEEQAEIVLSRNLQEIGPGQYKLSWDKRLKFPAPLNFTYNAYFELLNTLQLPILIVNASGSQGWDLVEKLHEEMQKQIKHYHVKSVEGNHDVHLTHPEDVGKHLSWFLNTKFDVKAKL